MLYIFRRLCNSDEINGAPNIVNIPFFTLSHLKLRTVLGLGVLVKVSIDAEIRAQILTHGSRKEYDMFLLIGSSAEAKALRSYRPPEHIVSCLESRFS